MDVILYSLDEINRENKKKALIFDSSSIITLNMINMLSILYKLKEDFNGEFIITNDVFNEIVKVPLGIKKYELRALFVKKAVTDGIFKVIKDIKLKKETENVLMLTNNIFKVHGESIKIIHRGEASCIALWDLLKVKNKIFVIDERTTRMLLERPINLKRLLEVKLHTKIEFNEEIAKRFEDKKIPIIRSTELLFVAYQNNKIDIKNNKKQIIDALLYGAKFYGCSISKREIEKLKREV